VSGGIKPGSGVDLQLERYGVVQLYAIQTSANTKNAGGRKTDIDPLKRAARPLRASKRHVELNIAVLGGRAKTKAMPSEPDIDVLGSDDFWAGITGIADFRARLLRLSVTLAPLVKTRGGDEVARLKREARALFGDSDGGLRLDVLANPPKKPRKAPAKKAKRTGDAGKDAIARKEH
jgi:hypothetical protein